ncbi:TPA: hypothetical protein N0F65_006011 [Lagenidium giganteum]|uniref:Uncharacterized protein n=1 Tax=Lagenidium giganteum TaxID=4803 RepID=A0AAV2Z9D9_9STRA|nr:TPA: hypothetical protein N0F65_006011 [Lagenidium giganteum]
MLQQYQNDTSAASATCTVTTIDFAQNVALPHLADTPSVWYFLSLISVSIFGIANTASRQNLVYSERTAGKQRGRLDARAVRTRHEDLG